MRAVGWAHRVLEFHERFGLEEPGELREMSPEQALLRLQMMTEELEELMEAIRLGRIYAQADALLDLVYFAVGTFLCLGFYPAEVEAMFREVHRANMAKEVAPGEGTKRSAGPGFDVVKPPGWRPPELRSTVAALRRSREEG